MTCWFYVPLLREINFCSHSFLEAHKFHSVGHKACAYVECGIWLALIIAVLMFVLYIVARGIYRYVTKDNLAFWTASALLVAALGRNVALCLFRLLPKSLKNDLFSADGNVSKYPALIPFRLRDKSASGHSEAGEDYTPNELR